MKGRVVGENVYKGRGVKMDGKSLSSIARPSAVPGFFSEVGFLPRNSALTR